MCLMVLKLMAGISYWLQPPQEGEIHAKFKDKNILFTLHVQHSEEGEILDLVQENKENEYTRNRILLMLKREPLSVKDVAGRLQACPADVLRHIVAMENAGTATLADVQDRSPRYMASNQ